MFIQNTFKALLRDLRLIDISFSLSKEALLIGLGSAFGSNPQTSLDTHLNLRPNLF